MNERIRQLAEEAELRATLLFNKENLERFAELIVKECVDVLNRRFMGDMNREDLEVRRCIADVKQHFGVE